MKLVFSTASVRVKQEPIIQMGHELSKSDPTRSRSEAYHAPVAEARIGHSGESKGDPRLSVRPFDSMDLRCPTTGCKARAPGCPIPFICRLAF